jgi:hypothetical protein
MENRVESLMECQDGQIVFVVVKFLADLLMLQSHANSTMPLFNCGK